MTTATSAPTVENATIHADASSGTVLEVVDLEVKLGRGLHRTRILNNVSLTVERGETVGIIGETGSGKTTLARTILGLTPAASGRVLVDGEDVTRFGRRQWRRLRRRGVVQYVFQDPLKSLDPDLTIGDSLTEPLLLQGVSRGEARDQAERLLAKVSLDADVLDRLPGRLSGGQRQRVAVARALITNPDVVILDEPVSALDAANRVQVLTILQELKAAGIALVFVSHDLGSVAGIADRIAVLYRGEVVEVGATRDVITNPQHAYTRLLLRSAPTLRTASADRTERAALRAQLTA
ncbi:AppF [Janibacter sp. HTCC2649]|uniref:ABC transporter ATP-binding protein n=1 Tax=Janibacter sp. HTCC2649 TaxID=313589 RepID=UPI0000670BF8|nr:ABC transporter ATP-binding protein [Janibacter sp. HTCC2649]EAQ00717.1 AppF [Janibacter sp. HTCC2649]